MTAIHPDAARHHLRRATLPVLVALLTGLGGCAGRPTAAVLDPVPSSVGVPKGSQALTVYAATNRGKDAQDAGFSSERTDTLTYERYTLTIPPSHKPANIEYPGPKPDPRRAMTVRTRQTLDRDGMVASLVARPGFDGTVALFVHGFNYRYQEGVFRIAQLSVDSKAAATPVLFSWPSEGALSGYLADRDAVLFSRDDLVSLILTLSKAPTMRQITVFGHSMGGFLIMEALRQLKLTGHGDVLDRLTVVLAAPDIDADLFGRQLDVIGRLKTPIVLLVSSKDDALAASSFLSGDRPRIGRLDVEDPKVREAAKTYGVLVVDITSLDAPDGLGHDRYASLAALAPQLTALNRPTGASAAEVGASILDVAGTVVASPFTVAGKILTPQ